MFLVIWTGPKIVHTKDVLVLGRPFPIWTVPIEAKIWTGPDKFKNLAFILDQVRDFSIF